MHFCVKKDVGGIIIVDVIFSVDCFLCNLSEEKNSKREIDLLNFIVVDVIFKRC